MVFVIPSHTSVTTVSPIINTYLDWLRLLITKVEPRVLSEWTKYAEVQSTTMGDPLRSYTNLLRSQQGFEKFTNSHRKQQHFLLYPSLFFFYFFLPPTTLVPQILQFWKNGLLMKFSGSHGLWVIRLVHPKLFFKRFTLGNVI